MTKCLATSIQCVNRIINKILNIKFDANAAPSEKSKNHPPVYTGTRKKEQTLNTKRKKKS